MIVLVDTHIAVWALFKRGQLKASTWTILEDPESRLVLSQVSLWEISIKHAIGKIALPDGFDAFVADLSDFGFSFLPIAIPHIRMQNKLPFRHRDPFDRMLVAQALVEDLPLVSVDTRLRDYGVRLII